jgi:putative nucleotidyltransferase with HDIG domain
MDRSRAWQLLNEYTSNPALIRHARCVEAAMRHYARINGADEDLWGVVGLLHDFDYERWPEPPRHTHEGARILREAGCDEEIVAAILSHAPWNREEHPLDRPLRKTLFAVDELCGFIYAIALMRPEKLEGMKPKSVTKKMKQRTFAASVSRDDITQGAELLALPLDDHINHCIEAIRAVAPEVGLADNANGGAG